MRGRRRRRRRGGGGGSSSSLTSSLAVMAENNGMEDVPVKDGAQPYSPALRCHLQARRGRGRGKVRHGWKDERQLRSQQSSHGLWKNVQDLKAEEDEPHLTLRPRNIRFSQAENMVLVSKLLPVYEQLLGQQKSKISFYKKSQMWQEICAAVNGAGHRQRTVHHCKKRVNDMKRQVRNKMNREKSNGGQGSPPSQVYYTKYEEELKKVLPAEIIDGIEFFDSDQPQDPYLEEEAGPSWFSQSRDQDQQKDILYSDAELPISLDSETEESPVIHGNPLPERSSVLTDITPTYSEESNPSGPTNTIADSHILQTKVPTKANLRGPPKKRSLYSSSKNIHSTYSRALTPTTYLNIVKANQHLFRKSMMHELNVLHMDFCQLTDNINVNYDTAKKMLQVESQRNHILIQMNNNIDRLAESIQQLANQQQTDRVLIHDLLQERRSRWNQKPTPLGEFPCAAH